MSKRQERFTYTADRSGFISSAGGWILLFVLEGSIIALLIVIFAPGLWLKLGLLSSFLGGLAYLILVKSCAPLWTRHELRADRLNLHYGRDRISIPRRAIASAEPVDGVAGQRFRPGAEHDPKTNALVVTFSTKGLVELRLSAPERFHLEAASQPVDRIVFNVDRREALLAALAHPTLVLEQADASTAMIAPVAMDEPTVTMSNVRRSPGVAEDTLAIVAHRLEARFGERVVVGDLDLAIRHGEVYTLLGANGAGKTTTLKMLVGLIAPSRGTVRIAGHDLDGEAVLAKRAFGYMPDRAILYDRLSGREFLRFLAQMRGLGQSESERRIDHLLAMFDLEDRQDSPAGSYSFGMKRKLSLAGALLHEPGVLILDEPLNGLDPPGARQLRDLLMERSRDGVGILLSTHDLTAAESLSDRIGIMHRGHLLAEGTVEDLTAGVTGPAIHRLEAAFLRATGSTPDERDASR